MEGISIKLPATLRRKLAQEAKRRNVAQSTIVRESLERALASSSDEGSTGSCAELVQDLVGCLSSGRSDLGSNKALLEAAMLEGSQPYDAKRRR